MLKAVELSDVTKLPPSAQNLQLLACQHASPPEVSSPPVRKPQGFTCEAPSVHCQETQASCFNNKLSSCSYCLHN
eukprot:1147367-Pelagomonas_calceolata.AAC.9